MSGLQRVLRPWHFEEKYRALAYGFRVRTNHAPAGRRLRPLLARFEGGENGTPLPAYALIRRRGRKSNRYIVLKDGETKLRSDSLRVAVDHVIWEVHDDAIKHSDQYLALHASAAVRDGAGFLFPAPAHSGKSTLVAGLMRNGFSYLTDEHALVDIESRSLQPFPRPLWLAPRIVAMLSEYGPPMPPELTVGRGIKHFIPPDDIQDSAVGQACPVRFVIVPRYVADARTRLEPISRGRVVMDMADESFNFARFGARGLATLRDVVAEAECYGLVIGNLGDAIEEVKGLVSA